MQLLFIPEFAPQQFRRVIGDLPQPLFKGLTLFGVEAGGHRALGGVDDVVVGAPLIARCGLAVVAAFARCFGAGVFVTARCALGRAAGRTAVAFGFAAGCALGFAAGGLLFGGLGVVAAIAGGWWPARSSQRMAPALALKGLGAPAQPGARRHTLAIALVALAAALAWAPPVGGIPLAAYLSVGLLLVGGIAALPLAVGALLDRVAPRVARLALPLLAWALRRLCAGRGARPCRSVRRVRPASSRPSTPGA